MVREVKLQNECKNCYVTYRVNTKLIHKKICHSHDHLEVNLALKPISPLGFPRALTTNPHKISNSLCGIVV